MQAPEPYVYEKLKPSFVRVLKLQPAQSKQSDLHCELIHCNLNELDNYEAISYVWGNSIFSEDLLVFNKAMKITASLYTALRQFREKDKERLLWADAICINQRDEKEKGIQVAMMSEIYKRAIRVIAFTGPAIENSSCSTMKDLARRAQEFGVRGDEFDTTGMPGPTLKNVPQFNASDFPVDALTEPFQKVVGLWHDLKGFFPIFLKFASPDWFTRLWIIQEVVVSKRMTLFYGEEELEWDDFALVTALSIAAVRWRKVDPSQWLLRSWSLVRLRNHFVATSQRNLFFEEPPLQQFWSFLFETVGHKCKDERDRIYALASLCPQQSQLIIAPDYARSTEEVYTDFAGQYVEAEGIDLLYYTGLNHRSTPKFYSDEAALTYFPSWVPEHRPAEIHPGWGP